MIQEQSKWLIEDMGADPLAVIETNGSTALHVAALNGRIGSIRNLLSKEKIPVDIGDEALCTPFHYACSKGLLRTVQVLIEEGGADMTMKDNQGLTCLERAKRHGKRKTVTYLTKVSDRI